MVYIHTPLPGLSTHARDLFHDAEEGRVRNIRSSVNNGYIANINQPLTIARESALHIATIQNNTITACALLDLGGDPNQPMFGGETPLIIAARMKNPILTDYMLAKGGKPSQGEQLNNTALHWVARHGNIDQLQIMLEAGGNVRQTNHRDENALHWSILNPDENVARLIVVQGADPKTTMIDGKNAIDRAHACGKDGLAGWLETAIPGQAVESVQEMPVVRSLSSWRTEKTASRVGATYRR